MSCVNRVLVIVMVGYCQVLLLLLVWRTGGLRRRLSSLGQWRCMAQRVESVRKDVEHIILTIISSNGIWELFAFCMLCNIGTFPYKFSSTGQAIFAVL